MQQDLNHARRAAGLLIAAAALPLTPLFAQETQPPAEPPPATSTAPPPAAQTAPVDLPATPAPTVTQAPAPTTVNVAPPTASVTTAAPRPASPPARTIVRAPVRTPASTATASRPVRAAPTAAATRPAPAAATPAPAPAATTTVATTAPTAAPAIAPAPEPVATTPAPVAPATRPTDTRASAMSVLPWVLIGLVVLGLIAFAFSRRRRREDLYEEDVVETPVETPVEPIAAAAPVAAAAAAERGRPWIDLKLEPVRAGVEGDEARVEFALKVDNNGAAPARDVRVSAFMLQAGASEAERSLIAPNEMPPVTVAAGETKQVETAVALPTDRVQGDAVLPVVVADARYTLPDGSEGRTSASFAVGVPDGEELAHFAVDNPSGLHDDVVARPMGEMEKA